MGDIIEFTRGNRLVTKPKKDPWIVNGALVTDVPWSLVFGVIRCKLKGKRLRIIGTFNLKQVGL